MHSYYISTTRLPLLLVLLSFVASLGVSATARASCVSPRFSLVWSSPADGASDVPLDANLQLLTTAKRLGTWQATLNDVVLDSDSPERFALGGLQPDTDYTFRLISTDRHTRVEMPAIEIKFRTGSSTASELAAPTVSGSRLEQDLPEMTEQCQAAFVYEACYDTVPSEFRSFDIEAGEAVAYLVGTKGSAPRLWPAGCEAFALERPAADSSKPICYEVTALDARGEKTEATEHCITPIAQREQAVRADEAATCSVQRIARAQPSGWFGLTCIGFVALFLGRRRALDHVRNPQG